jgi:hypothetical protein
MGAEGKASLVVCRLTLAAFALGTNHQVGALSACSARRHYAAMRGMDTKSNHDHSAHARDESKRRFYQLLRCLLV